MGSFPGISFLGFPQRGGTSSVAAEQARKALREDPPWAGRLVTEEAPGPQFKVDADAAPGAISQPPPIAAMDASGGTVAIRAGSGRSSSGKREGNRVAIRGEAVQSNESRVRQEGVEAHTSCLRRRDTS